eukprot:maker-scaffold2236_size18378-snap-gene-0.8 protein:Tk10366 transcript:maker-scaffold2236_size18378-snap-gene-0.8-mRNA-1 annotation:"double-stranded rna-binding protein staufen homolog 2 isoform x7"
MQGYPPPRYQAYTPHTFAPRSLAAQPPYGPPTAYYGPWGPPHAPGGGYRPPLAPPSAAQWDPPAGYAVYDYGRAAGQPPPPTEGAWNQQPRVESPRMRSREPMGRLPGPVPPPPPPVLPPTGRCAPPRAPAGWSPRPRYPTKLFVPAATDERAPGSGSGGWDEEAESLPKLHYLAAHNHLLPQFQARSDNGAFQTTLILGTETYEGAGATAKAAQQSAAQRALAETKYPKKTTMRVRPPGSTSTSELNELATKKGLQVEFRFLEPPNFQYSAAMKQWKKEDMRAHYRVQLTIGGNLFLGEADMPQQAKHNASSQAIPVIQVLPDIKVVAQQQALKNVSSASTSSSDIQSDQSQISADATSPASQTTATTPTAVVHSVSEPSALLNRIAMSRNTPLVWEVVGESGPPHQKIFTLKCVLGEHQAMGTGSSKKLAKTLAASELIKTLPEDWREPSTKSKKRAKKRAAQPDSTQRVAVPGAESEPPSASEDTSTPAPSAVLIGPVAPSPNKIAKKEPTEGKRIEEVIQAANPISALHEFAKRAKLPDPIFECVSENVLETWESKGKIFRKTEYTMRLDFKEKQYLASGTTKKQAKAEVAAAAWNVIRAELSHLSPAPIPGGGLNGLNHGLNVLGIVEGGETAFGAVSVAAPGGGFHLGCIVRRAISRPIRKEELGQASGHCGHAFQVDGRQKRIFQFCQTCDIIPVLEQEQVLVRGVRLVTVEVAIPHHHPPLVSADVNLLLEAAHLRVQRHGSKGALAELHLKGHKVVTFDLTDTIDVLSGLGERPDGAVHSGNLLVGQKVYEIDDMSPKDIEHPPTHDVITQPGIALAYNAAHAQANVAEVDFRPHESGLNGTLHLGDGREKAEAVAEERAQIGIVLSGLHHAEGFVLIEASG